MAYLILAFSHGKEYHFRKDEIHINCKLEDLSTMRSDQMKSLGVKGQLKVKEALRKWDPIGVYDLSDWPEGEYDSYSAPVVSLLDRSATKEEIVAYLKTICIEVIGASFDRMHTEAIVEELIAYWLVCRQKVCE